MSTYYQNGHTGYQATGIELNDSRFANIVGRIKKLVPQGSRILDLGCGDQPFARLLPDYKLTGMDVDKRFSSSVIEHDLQKAPYPLQKGSQDAVICSEVLEHLWEPEIAMREAKRLIVAKGHVFVTVPNFDSLDNLLDGHRGSLYNKEDVFSVEHIRQYTPKTMALLMLRCGFELVDITGNSPQGSKALRPMRGAMKRVLSAQWPTVTDVEVDQALGEVLFEYCPGMLLVGRSL